MNNTMKFEVAKKLLNSKGFNKKLKAFTLIELTVTLIISGLIVLASFQVINHFSSVSLRMGRTNESYNRTLQFHKAISRDMNKALKIVHYDDETIFHMPDEVLVSYKWQYDCMVRTVNEVVDTFFVQVTDWHMVKDRSTGLPIILELEIINEDDEEQESELYRVIKKYDNDVLFNCLEFKN